MGIRLNPTRWMLAAVVMAADRWSPMVVPGGHVVAQVTRLGLAIGAGFATLVLFARVLNVEELDDALVRLRERFGSAPAD